MRLKPIALNGRKKAAEIKLSIIYVIQCNKAGGSVVQSDEDHLKGIVTKSTLTQIGYAILTGQIGTKTKADKTDKKGRHVHI